MVKFWLFNRKDTRTDETSSKLHQTHDQQLHWRHEHRWSTYFTDESALPSPMEESGGCVIKNHAKIMSVWSIAKNTIGNNILAELHSIHHALRTVFTHFKNNATKRNNCSHWLSNSHQNDQQYTDVQHQYQSVKLGHYFRNHQSDKISEICWYQGQMWLDTQMTSWTTLLIHWSKQLPITQLYLSALSVIMGLCALTQLLWNSNNTTQFPPRNSKENCRKNLIKTNKTVNNQPSYNIAGNPQ